MLRHVGWLSGMLALVMLGASCSGDEQKPGGGQAAGSGGTDSGAAGTGGGGGVAAQAGTATGGGSSAADASTDTGLGDAGAESGAATPQGCAASADCPASAPVCVSGLCQPCTVGAATCDGATPRLCDANGAWQSGAACTGSTPLCWLGSCVECQPGTQQCDPSGAAVTCSDTGVWGTPVACVSPTPVCVSGTCLECQPGTGTCDGATPRTCDASGTWVTGALCSGATPVCSAGACVAPASCAGGSVTCGSAAQSCCTTLDVAAGTFNRSNDAAYPATVSAFRLDRYEVTVGRFRAFVNGYPGDKPSPGAGAHPAIAGSGWDKTWSRLLPKSKSDLSAALACDPAATWTNAAGSPTTEQRPINCVSWYLAFAFCAWDSGRLPTEAEWNYAAAGGAEQRVYPWSVPPDSTTIDTTYASYDCMADGVAGCTLDDLAAVGSFSPLGDGLWGHSDLGGNVFEWALDWYENPYSIVPCADCASLATGNQRVIRGGDYSRGASLLMTSARFGRSPDAAARDAGLRCARDL